MFIQTGKLYELFIYEKDLFFFKHQKSQMFSLKQLALVIFTTLPYRQYNFFVDHRKTNILKHTHFKLFSSNNSFIIWNRSFIRGAITVRCAFGYYSFAPKGNRTQSVILVYVFNRALQIKLLFNISLVVRNFIERKIVF